jgi:hypothetical protein
LTSPSVRDQRAGVCVEVGAAGLDVDPGGVGLLFGQPDHRGLGERVDAGRHHGVKRFLEADLERAAHGDSGVLHRH